MEKMTVQDLETEILEVLQNATHSLIELLLDYLISQVGISLNKKYNSKDEEVVL